MPTQAFLKPVLKGGRFDEHTVPLTFLSDLAAFNDIIFEVAKAAYFAENKGRKKLPSGFKQQQTALVLEKIGEGSTLLTIALLLSTLGGPQGEAASNLRYYELARETVVAAIVAADAAPELPPPNPAIKTAIKHFKSFGAGLRDGESIEFPLRDGRPPVQYTKEIQRKIILAEPGEREIFDEGELRGLVVELDQSARRFRLRLADGREVIGPTSREHIENIEGGVSGFRKDIKVSVQGTLVRDRANKLVRIEKIEQSVILDPLDVAAQLDDIRVLKSGWNEGYGVSFSSAQLDWFEQTAENFFPDKAPAPRIFPDLDGALQLEWVPGAWRADLEVDMSSKLASYHAVDVDTNIERIGEYDLGTIQGWDELQAELSIIHGA